MVLANKARVRFGTKEAAEILKTVKQYLPAILQVGGDETTGKGYCATRFVQANGESQGEDHEPDEDPGPESGRPCVGGGEGVCSGPCTGEPGKKVRDEAAKKYGTQVRKLPTRIIASGLGQALAFLVAKGECPDLLCALADWVLLKRKDADNKAPSPPADALLRAVVDGSCDDLRRHTGEALAYLQWLVRFAEAEGLTDDPRD